MNYSYGNSDWKDLLTGYNGTAISYDLSGNPLNWRNASSLSWDGRRLAGMTLADGSELAFEYNSDGLRTGKTVGNSTVQYVWNDGNLVAEIRDGYTLKFYYNNGEIAGFSYNGTDYYYGKDSFGVIHYLYNTSGEIVTTYTYDAWGTVLSVTGTLAETVGTVNPVRYKGYYFDPETGWYYLQSRYYDPVVGRFLNADAVEFLGASISVVGYNLFAYADSNPVNYADPFGNWIISLNTKAVGYVLELLIMVTLPYILTAFKATRLAAWARTVKVFRKIYDKAIAGLSVMIYNAMDLIMYNIAGKAANAATRAFTIAGIKTWLAGILSFSIGYGIARIIDHFDRDGSSGYIRF